MNITSQQVKELKKYNINAKEINDIDIILDKLSSYMINNLVVTLRIFYLKLKNYIMN